MIVGTLAFENANSKFLDIVSVADVYAKECVDHILVEIFNLNICQDIEGKVLSRLGQSRPSAGKA